MTKLQLAIVLAVLAIPTGFLSIWLGVQGFARADPPPDQPILHGAEGLFRCKAEADAWIQLASVRGSTVTTPNDVDMWLRSWRNRGGGCKLK